MINLRGKIIPVEPIAQYLPQKTRTTKDTDKVQQILALVTGDDRQQIAFSIDRVVGKQSIVV
jgi:chemotaxis protein histidine kinase CheA